MNSQDLPSPQCYCDRLPPSVHSINGDCSGNTGSHFRINSDNPTIINYYSSHGGANLMEFYAEILGCLYTSRYESHRGRVRKPVEGTCTWVTEHPKYKDWLEKATSDLLWISGDPGCGKSVLTSFLVNHLKMRTDAIVCYFYFNDDRADQRNSTFALCAILHQLFTSRNSLCRYAELAFKTKGKRFTEEVETLWGILVDAVADAGCGSVICVLDALDECEEQALAQITRLLINLPQSKSSHISLKFLVTSRPYHKIEKHLGFGLVASRLKGEEEVNAIATDVTRVIDNGITELEGLWENPGGLEYLRNLLKSSADHTFLWVSCVLDILKNSEYGSREDFTKIVSTTPCDLAEFYSRILDKSTDPDKARRILHIVVAAARPLTVAEMHIALALSRDQKSMRDIPVDLYPGSERTVKNLCGLFVRVIDSQVFLIHRTARDFLIKGALHGRGRWQYTLDPADSSFILADICISYLSLQGCERDPFVMGGLGAVRSARRDAVQYYIQKHAPFAYAAHHWQCHLRDTGSRVGLLGLAQLICTRGSKGDLPWSTGYREDSGRFHPFLNSISHLTVVSWPGPLQAFKQQWKRKRGIVT